MSCHLIGAWLASCLDRYNSVEYLPRKHKFSISFLHPMTFSEKDIRYKYLFIIALQLHVPLRKKYIFHEWSSEKNLSCVSWKPTQFLLDWVSYNLHRPLKNAANLVSNTFSFFWHVPSVSARPLKNADIWSEGPQYIF